jgi:acetyltransferase-like isoleucine patch superfamily enzyme
MFLNFYYKFLFPFFYKGKFGYFGNKSLIFNPLKITGKKNIFISNNVTVNKYTWLAASPDTNQSTCKLVIGDGCQIGHFNHIYATNEIVIEDNVLTADKVYISDNSHSYNDISKPIMYQKVVQLNKVKIGSGSWIGENVCIIGASIGKNCVIGANSVVTKDIPDYSVAVGAPAKVIKNI